MDWVTFFSSMQWGVYALIFIAPFIQEDAAVIGAASASMTGADPLLAFAALIAGLSISDTWKYWLGRAAHAFAWTRKAAARPEIAAAKDKVLGRLGLTLLVARFVPGTRIPLYLAAGVFRAPFARFAAYVVASGMLYAGLMFGLFHILGQAVGEQARTVLPWVALSIVALVLAAQVLRTYLARKAAAARLSSASG